MQKKSYWLAGAALLVLPQVLSAQPVASGQDADDGQVVTGNVITVSYTHLTLPTKA